MFESALRSGQNVQYIYIMYIYIYILCIYIYYVYIYIYIYITLIDYFTVSYNNVVLYFHPYAYFINVLLMHEPVNCVYFYESTFVWKPQPICCIVMDHVICTYSQDLC